jgi:hypothetical protein
MNTRDYWNFLVLEIEVSLDDGPFPSASLLTQEVPIRFHKRTGVEKEQILGMRFWRIALLPEQVLAKSDVTW